MKTKSLSRRAFSRVFLSLLVHVASIAVGAALLGVAAYAVFRGAPLFFDNIAPEICEKGGLAGVYLVIGLVIVLLILLICIVILGIHFIRPLYTVYKNKLDSVVEISHEDSPRLYDMVMETAQASGVRKPRKVYVCHEPDTKIFFDINLLNLFLPTRTEIAVGLGVADSMNEKELRSILAFWFGLLAGNNFVADFIFKGNMYIDSQIQWRGTLDRILLKLSLSGGILGVFGKVAQYTVIGSRKLLEYCYIKQQAAVNECLVQKLNGADELACRITDTESFVSALTKMEMSIKSFKAYDDMLEKLAVQGKTVSDYWEGYEKAKPVMELKNMSLSSFDKVETEIEETPWGSRISFDKSDLNYPVRDLIEHAKSLAIKKNDSNAKSPAWNLVPPSIKSEVSAKALSSVNKNNSAVSTIDWNEYSEILNEKFAPKIFPKELKAFFNRNLIFASELFSGNEGGETQYPLTSENKAVILEFEQALADQKMLSQISEGRMSVEKIRYNGVEYSVSDIPVAEHEQYVGALRDRAGKIDGDVRTFATAKAADRKLIDAAYHAIEYAQSITATLVADFIPVLEDMCKKIVGINYAGENDFDELSNWLDSYESALVEIVKSLRLNQIAPFMTKEDSEQTASMSESSHLFLLDIDPKNLAKIVDVTNSVYRVHEKLGYSAKMVIVNVIMDKELPDVRFLDLWRQPEDNAQ